MKHEELQEILHCLADERRVFSYFKDRYCLDLLRLALEKANGTTGQDLPIAALRQGRFARLLGKEIVKKAMAAAGSGRLSTVHLQLQWPQYCQQYLLTLGRWGEGRNEWQQTSRPGCNLVLQVNFTRQHDQDYQRAIRPKNRSPFTYWGHPVHHDGRNTMAWVRIDCSFTSGEALIEELQTDWLREVLWLGKRLRSMKHTPERCRRLLDRRGIEGDMDRIDEYLTSLDNHCRIWQEAALTAAIGFITEELGLTRIFLHSHETGRVMKRIKDTAPPRSLYTSLPKSFCFLETEEAPAFILADAVGRRRLKKTSNPRWFLLTW